MGRISLFLSLLLLYRLHRSASFLHPSLNAPPTCPYDVIIYKSGIATSLWEKEKVRMELARDEDSGKVMFVPGARSAFQVGVAA